MSQSVGLISSLAVERVELTVQQLLLGRVEESSSLNSMGSLSSLSSGESPAGTTSTLVLNRSNNTLGDPIDGASSRRVGSNNSVSGFRNLARGGVTSRSERNSASGACACTISNRSERSFAVSASTSSIHASGATSTAAHALGSRKILAGTAVALLNASSSIEGKS